MYCDVQEEFRLYELIRKSLDLRDPWMLAGIEFDSQKQQWNLFIDFRRGVNFVCPLCGSICSAHESYRRSWRFLDMLEWKTFIHASLPRFYCEHCMMERIQMVPSWSKKEAHEC